MRNSNKIQFNNNGKFSSIVSIDLFIHDHLLKSSNMCHFDSFFLNFCFFSFYISGFFFMWKHLREMETVF